MTAARWAGLAWPLTLLAASFALMTVLTVRGRWERRRAARAAERAARPHSAHVGTAAQDAEEIAVADLRKALRGDGRVDCPHCNGAFLPHRGHTRSEL